MEQINTTNEEKLQLLTEMQELREKLERIPDRFDWYIYKKDGASSSRPGTIFLSRLE